MLLTNIVHGSMITNVDNMTTKEKEESMKDTVRLIDEIK
jgi:hypothetical protein